MHVCNTCLQKHYFTYENTKNQQKQDCNQHTISKNKTNKKEKRQKCGIGTSQNKVSNN